MWCGVVMEWQGNRVIEENAISVMVSGVCSLSLCSRVCLSLSLREFGCGAGGWRTYDR